MFVLWISERMEEFPCPAEVTECILPQHRISPLRTDIVIHSLYALQSETQNDPLLRCCLSITEVNEKSTTMEYFNKPEPVTFIHLFSYHGSESRLPLFGYHKKSFSEAGTTGINIDFLAFFFPKA